VFDCDSEIDTTRSALYGLRSHRPDCFVLQSYYITEYVLNKSQGIKLCTAYWCIK